jgi:hypothetical protein
MRSSKVTFPGWRPPVGHIEIDGLGELSDGDEARLATVVLELDRVHPTQNAKRSMTTVCS